MGLDALNAKLAEVDADFAALQTAKAADQAAGAALAAAEQAKDAAAAGVLSDAATLRAGKDELLALVNSTFPDA